ncbi:U-box domain-containing protein 43 [Linum perenne]
MDFIPIGTMLALLTKQVIKTAQAANDILIEKDSFKVLSQHLFDIEPVLKELQLQKLNDSQAARLALEILQSDVNKATNLVDKYKNRSRFYLLLRCRHIVNEVQQVTRDIGKSLAAISLANTEVLGGISDQVHRLQHEMQRVKLEASDSQLQIIDKLNHGLRDQKLDLAFANDMLAEIASAVGVPVEPLQISREMASFKMEKEEAASRKERAEELFLEQVIELLSRADAARDYEQVEKQYYQRLRVVERYDPREECITPLNPFLCRITRTLMIDPVSLCTGTTCERAAIVARFDRGETTDPETGEVLEDMTLRPNFPLRQSIEEWRELNYCLRIRACNAKLLSGEELLIEEALSHIQNLLRENTINKYWVSIGGLTDHVTKILGCCHNKDLKRKLLVTMKEIIEGNARNKEMVANCEGWDHIVSCLADDQSISKAAVELLVELLLDRSDWNISSFKKLSLQGSSIPSLVTLLNGPETDSAVHAEKLLNQLFEIDEENILHAAKSGWYKPLMDRIIQGPESSRISMMKSLVSMELFESDMNLLGREGIIPCLLDMVASGDIQSKDLSLSAMVKLSSCRTNKELIASAGGIPLILRLLFSPQTRYVLVAKCCEVLESVSSNGDGIEFFVDQHGKEVDLEPIVTNLLTLRIPISSIHVRKPALGALVGICQSDAGLVKAAVLTPGGVTLVLSLLDDTDSEIRELAINMLFLFSHHEPEGLVEYLLRPKRLDVLVGFLEKEGKSDVQKAAAGLLANLPKSEVTLTKKLIELEGINALINIVRVGNMDAKENALSALFRFTDPMNLESQRIVVEQGAYALLVDLLRTGSVTAKARAAALIGDLSASTPKLVVVSRSPFCWCFRPRRPNLCPAHEGMCSVKTTFCLMEANALPGLVRLLKSQVDVTAVEAIQALSTLIQPTHPNRGANVLHDADAIRPVIEILNWGSDSLKEEALGLLQEVFRSREMVELYGSVTRLMLAGFVGRSIHENGGFERKASIVLALLERNSRSSSSLLPGFF